MAVWVRTDRQICSCNDKVEGSVHVGKRKLIDEGGAGFCEELHVDELATPALAQLHEGPHMILGGDDLHPASHGTSKPLISMFWGSKKVQ